MQRDELIAMLSPAAKAGQGELKTTDLGVDGSRQLREVEPRSLQAQLLADSAMSRNSSPSGLRRVGADVSMLSAEDSVFAELRGRPRDSTGHASRVAGEGKALKASGSSH